MVGKKRRYNYGWHTSFDHHFKKREGVSILVSTHYMDEALTCDAIGFMYSGELLVNGTPQSIMNKWKVDSLDELFIKLVEQQESLSRGGDMNEYNEKGL